MRCNKTESGMFIALQPLFGEKRSAKTVKYLLFLIHIHDLSNGVVSRNYKLFIKHTSLFPVVNETQTSATNLSNNQLRFLIGNIFNPELTKQAQQVICSRKTKKLLHSALLFNDNHLATSCFRNILV